VFFLTAGLLLSSLVLGGATSSGFLSEAVLQLAAIPVLLVGIWRMIDASLHGQAKLALLFCLGLVLVPLLQLVPLPSSVWTSLPGREIVVSALSLSFPDLPWMPLSLSPRSTWLGLLSLLPPLAIFIAVQQLSYQERRKLSLLIIVLGIISVFLGLLQLMQGPQSSLRFFEITNPTEAVGFFANRNHYAALLYSVLVLAAAWMFAQLTDIGISPRAQRGFDASQVLYMFAGFTVMVVILSGILMSRSRAGLGLAIIAFIGIYLMSFSDKGQESRKRSSKLIWAASALALVFALQFALFRIMDRLGKSVSEDLRFAFARVTTEAIWDVMPFGTGIGSFVPTFKLYETTGDLPGRLYANRAHNDFLEWWLETGGAGILMLSLFVVFFVYRTYQIWRYPLIGGRDIDHVLAKAATIIVPLLLLHSFVDYPLRTTAMLSIMAFTCALLIKPAYTSIDEDVLEYSEHPRDTDIGRSKRQSRSARQAAQPPRASGFSQSRSPPSSSQQQQPLQLKDTDWPEAWRKSADKKAKKTNGT